MSTIAVDLPLVERLTPTTQQEVSELIRRAAEENAAIYPLGGETSLEFGLPAKQEGWGLELQNLRRVVDYPARDMTITVEAGVSLKELRETLASENQRLPFDVPCEERATIGGIVATAWNGPRRFGCGAIRDFVIGIQAVDGTGLAFKGGGRVVKNVAGYDFCKLLTGSLGTLAVITQVTLRVIPQVEKSVFVAAPVEDETMADALFNTLASTTATPTAVEFLGGRAWASEPALAEMELAERTPAENRSGGVFVAGLEGQADDVDWMQQQLIEQWRPLCKAEPVALADKNTASLWRGMANFSAADFSAAVKEGERVSPLVVKASLAPRGMAPFVRAAREIDPNCSFEARAEGVVVVRFSEFPADGLSRTLVAKLQPAAAAFAGHLTLLSCAPTTELTHQSVWGGSTAAHRWMNAIKQRFDPQNLLNPGRFVYV